ncbi:distal tail protein Dit [Bacillus luti]|uniref:Phage tail family protein n=1 Tax=Bacillus luti TaxID=2026191 RepID=A0A7V7V4M8_9BACI|nr:distal tail protein Dit [Bacillus luti]KAB2441372.1 phage tail family protein [Bacillus luti]
MSSFTFNNIRNDYIQIKKGWSPPTWAPLKRNFLTTPGYPGARLLSTDTEPRPLPVPVGIIVPDGADLETLKEEIADWLITEQEAELVFDVRPDRTYLAVVDDSFDLDEFVTLGIGTIQFICPMPYKLGPVQKKMMAIDQAGKLRAEMYNKGSIESNPIINITIGAQSPFLDVWNDDDYFRIGYPVGHKSKIVKEDERLINDDCSSLNGWETFGGQIGKFLARGSMEVVGGKAFKASNYGAMEPFKWRGPFVMKEIPKAGKKITDFKMDVQFALQSTKYDQMGKTIAMVLDANYNIICQVDMSDEYMSHEITLAHSVVGSEGNNEQLLSNETGHYMDTFNQFSGHFAIARRGNHWRVYCAKYIEGTEQDGASFVHEWYDVGNWNPNTTREPKYVVVGCVAFGEYNPVNVCQIKDVKFWRINTLEIDETPYIFDVGDKVQIDTERSLVTVNGTNAIALKDIFSSFPVVKRGKNEMIVRPSDVGVVEVMYRERYR